MSKFVQKTYGNTKDILKFVDHYVGMPVTVSDVGITANADGVKTVPAGTIIGGGFLTDPTVGAVKTNAAGAEGVLLHDTDVTYGPAAGTAIIHGFIAIGKLPEAPTADAKTALNQITFIQ